MSDPGPAQLDLIRRYSRAMREMQAQARRARSPRAAASPSVAIGDRVATRQAAKRFTKLPRELPGA